MELLSDLIRITGLYTLSENTIALLALIPDLRVDLYNPNAKLWRDKSRWITKDLMHLPGLIRDYRYYYMVRNTEFNGTLSRIDLVQRELQIISAGVSVVSASFRGPEFAYYFGITGPRTLVVVTPLGTLHKEVPHQIVQIAEPFNLGSGALYGLYRVVVPVLTERGEIFDYSFTREIRAQQKWTTKVIKHTVPGVASKISNDESSISALTRAGLVFKVARGTPFATTVKFPEPVIDIYEVKYSTERQPFAISATGQFLPGQPEDDIPVLKATNPQGYPIGLDGAPIGLRGWPPGPQNRVIAITDSRHANYLIGSQIDSFVVWLYPTGRIGASLVSENGLYGDAYLRQESQYKATEAVQAIVSFARTLARIDHTQSIRIQRTDENNVTVFIIR